MGPRDAWLTRALESLGSLVKMSQKRPSVWCQGARVSPLAIKSCKQPSKKMMEPISRLSSPIALLTTSCLRLSSTNSLRITLSALSSSTQLMSNPIVGFSGSTVLVGLLRICLKTTSLLQAQTPSSSSAGPLPSKR